MTVILHKGDCLDVLPTLPANTLDSCVTDPPYYLDSIAKRYGKTSLDRDGTNERRARDRSDPAGRLARGFMGKNWDDDVAMRPETWAAVLRVLKPGAHLVAFGGTRTHHRVWCAIEDAGFEIRDTIMWVYGSGFPKSHNQGDGWGTALKPAWEPIVLARKPLAGTVAQTREAFGTGAINIDGCRVSSNGETPAADRRATARKSGKAPMAARLYGDGKASTTEAAGVLGRRGSAETYLSERPSEQLGRWPANLIHDGSDEVVGCFPVEAGAAAPVHRRGGDKFRKAYGSFKGDVDEGGSTFRGDSGSAARFFYCAKASRADREAGLDGMDEKPLHWSSGSQNPGSFQSAGTKKQARNNHPTVKPTELMRYLCRLVTPKGGTVLDPFMGSGSTGRAAVMEGFNFTGIEREAEYLAIASRRIDDLPLFGEARA